MHIAIVKIVIGTQLRSTHRFIGQGLERSLAFDLRGVVSGQGGARICMIDAAFSHLVIDQGEYAVRRFKTENIATDFLIRENASPPRFRYILGNALGAVKSETLGQLGNGGSILNSRDGGWDSRGFDGWSRFRYCRPLSVKNV